MIKVFNNFLPEEYHKRCFNYCKDTKNYQYGETDSEGLPPTGMVSNIEINHPMIQIFHEKFLEKISEVKNLNLYRSYINCFAPSENPYFHVDSDDQKSLTMLYYPNINWDINDGGETQFLIDDSITGVLPIPNRLVCFPAHVLHKATSFRSGHRFTIAFKYS